MWRVAVVACVACWTSDRPTPTRATAVPRAPLARGVGLVDGASVDAKTRECLPGIHVFIGDCCAKMEVEFAITDERGRFRVELPSGRCGLSASVDDQEIERQFDVSGGRTTTVELAFDHDAVLREKPIRRRA